MEGKTIETTSSLVEVKRNWEDLSMDCLIKVFERVGLESLILDIPFVCKSWYKASLDPLCYKLLYFEFLPLNRSSWAIKLTRDASLWPESIFPKAVPSMQFIKIAVHRSCGMATELKFPNYHSTVYGDNTSLMEAFFSVKSLEYVLERCPALKTLTLPVFSFKRLMAEINECLLKMICKLKNLESLMILNTEYLFNEILNQIHIHCPNFRSLTAKIHHIHIYCFQPKSRWDQIPNDIASAIVTFLPDIKHLVLRDACLARESLLLILSGCRKLELLDVTKCRGFDADDAEILTLASHIKIFKSEGSVVYEHSDDDDYGLPTWIDSDYSDDDDDFFGVNLNDGAGDNLEENNGYNSDNSLGFGL
ncbi:hypothetical protein AQUCO_04100043v1 [Aquilegia coerulea]|uniref:F-box domain-containing protein n=1 Tax=Aquilegia coerulea TaxID=218851 RepID=A0A2G5CQ14_AQUCA|nr:hypothetical protein AQUCO_04100043v1 [Aquilegia coerulea]